MKISCFILACALASLPALSHGASLSTGELLFDQAGWDYSPSSLIDMDGKQKVWWCGQSNGHDVVKYRERYPRGTWSAARIVLQSDRFTNPKYPLPWEGIHTCDPSVVRGEWNLGGTSYGYAMYYTTERPGSNGIDNRIAVAFSKDGITWLKYGQPVIHDGDPGAYGTGQSIAWSGNAAAMVKTVYTYTDETGTPNYFYRESTDGVTFGPRRGISKQGLTLNDASGISYANPAIAFAPRQVNGDYYYYMASVCETYNDSPYGPDHREWATARGVCIYRAEGEDAFNGTWQLVLGSGHIKPVEVEPGFVTDIYGYLNDTPPVTVLFGCSGAGDPNTWEVCWADGQLP